MSFRSSMVGLLLLSHAVAFALGCRSWHPDYSLTPSAEEEQIDSLWRQGYGFNNPNPERIRNGQPAVNFDGREATLENEIGDFIGRMIGNAITFIFIETGAAIWDGMKAGWRKLSHWRPFR